MRAPANAGNRRRSTIFVVLKTQNVPVFYLSKSISRQAKDCIYEIRRLVRVVAIAFAAIFSSSGVWAVSVTPEELQQNDQWVQQNLLGAPAVLLHLQRVSSSDPAAHLVQDIQTTQLDAGARNARSRGRIPTTDLEVRCTSVEYADFPVVEWTAYLRNTGTANTPTVAEHPRIEHAPGTRATGGEFVLRGIEGDSCSAGSYQPYEQRSARTPARASRRRRTADQRRVSLLQSDDAGRRCDPGRRLAGTMGHDVRPRRAATAAGHGRPGIDAPLSASRARKSARRWWPVVLEGVGHRAGAKPLAAVDARPQ